MLVKATLEDIKKLQERIYKITLNPEKSSYPTYADGIKTKADFFKSAKEAVIQENNELYLFVENGNVEGWLSYFWIEEDNYLQLTSCNINRFYRKALDELLIHLEEHFKGYTLYFGFSSENNEAIQFLEESGFNCIEKSCNHSFFFDDDCIAEVDKNVERITRENFEYFKKIYHPEETVYWNTDRIYNTIDNWLIFVYRQNENVQGTVFLRGEQHYFEIYDMEFADDIAKENSYYPLMSAVLNVCKDKEVEFLTYFSSEEEKEKLCKLGFQYIGQYLLYIKAI